MVSNDVTHSLITLPAHSIKEKSHFLVSLTTLSNQDRELDPPVLVPTQTVVELGKLPVVALPVTDQVMENA